VSFLIVLVSACIVQLWPDARFRPAWTPALIAGGALAGACGYGVFRLQTAPAPDVRGQLNVVLLQGTRDKIFEANPKLDERTVLQYWDLMRRAAQQSAQLDLIVWPEATFTTGGNYELLAEASLPAAAQPRFEQQARVFTDYAARAADTAARVWSHGEFHKRRVSLLVGAETVLFRPESLSIYNSALLIDPGGKVVDRYYKSHLVMFGEYIPWGDVFPWIYSLTPMPRGLTRGAGPASFAVNDYRISPNICFEITVPHLIRDHVNRLEREEGRAPDVLVNVTDDGWFWGSAVLDFQLACGVFRAVEMRRPLLVAANTGISVWIDGNGKVLRRAAKRREELVVAQVSRDGRNSWYRRWGDWPALLCLTLSCGWAVYARWPRRPAGGGSHRGVVLAEEPPAPAG
jgi:apolipoprotein N-acyltransferase